MNYEQTINFMFNSLPVFQNQGASAYKPGLESTINFLKKLENPHKKFKTIHIAGTNGKGSCSHILASVLQRAGYKTGLYTSPHLYDFRERIKIDGAMISENQVVDFIARNKNNIKGLSFFEMCVGMAFDHFALNNVDIAIIETGLGGRLDSTNVITPLVSIITNIGLDHTNLLGGTLALIAREKAGIIKTNTPIIIGEHNAQTDQVFKDRAEELDAPIIFAEDIYTLDKQEYTASTQKITLKNKQTNTQETFECDLLGEYQQKNIKTILSSINILTAPERHINLKISAEDLAYGIAHAKQSTGLRGRWEIRSLFPLTVCDTGHNAHGVREVVAQIGKQRFNKLYIVLGVVNDKDLDSVLTLMPQSAYYIFTQASIERALSADKLSEAGARHNLYGETVPGVDQAYQRAKALATEDDMIFIGGSTFTVSDLKE